MCILQGLRELSVVEDLEVGMRFEKGRKFVQNSVRLCHHNRHELIFLVAERPRHIIDTSGRWIMFTKTPRHPDTEHFYTSDVSYFPRYYTHVPLDTNHMITGCGHRVRDKERMSEISNVVRPAAPRAWCKFGTIGLWPFSELHKHKNNKRRLIFNHYLQLQLILGISK